MKLRLALSMVTILSVRAGTLSAQQPTTVVEAARTIDLETFPLMPGGVSKAPRRLANLGYTARGDARGAYAFQKKTLEERGWKELPGGYLSDQSCSGNFGKNGFTVSVSTTPGYGPEAAGLVDIRLSNHGNVDVAKLPVPPGSKSLYSFPTVAAYVTEQPVKETWDALLALMTAKGWQPYGHAGDSLYFKQNAVKLSAWPSVAPAQGGKTVIQLSTELMSVDLPAPPALIEAAYADTTKALSLDVDMKHEDLAAFYKESLGKAGWKPTTEQPFKIDFREMMIFRNGVKDILTLKMHDFEGKLRVSLEHQTAAELAEAIRLAEAEESKRKAESAAYAKSAAEAAARDRVTVAITVPANARSVKRDKGKLEFKLGAGQGRAAAQAIHAALLQQGWKPKPLKLEPMAGTLTLEKKPGVTLVVVYLDTGFADAEIMVTSFGVDIQSPKAK